SSHASDGPSAPLAQPGRGDGRARRPLQRTAQTSVPARRVRGPGRRLCHGEPSTISAPARVGRRRVALAANSRNNGPIISEGATAVMAMDNDKRLVPLDPRPDDPLLGAGSQAIEPRRAPGYGVGGYSGAFTGATDKGVASLRE